MFWIGFGSGILAMIAIETIGIVGWIIYNLLTSKENPFL